MASCQSAEEWSSIFMMTKGGSRVDQGLLRAQEKVVVGESEAHVDRRLKKQGRLGQWLTC